MSSWLKLLGLPSASWPRVRLMLACSALYGLTRASYIAAANALFVVAFGSEGYPWTYVAAAVVVPVLALFVRRAQDRWSVGVYLSALFGVLLVPVLLFRGALAFTTAPALLFVVLLFNEVIFAFGSAAFWGLAGRLFDVREAKRVFGLIGSGEVVATIAAAAAVPWLIDLVGTPNLLWLSAAGIAGCLGCVQVASRRYRGRLLSGDEQVAGRPRASGRQREGRPYIRLIFAISVLNTFVFYLADMMFYATVESRFTDADAIGRFLGGFLAVTGIATLIARVLSGRLLTWLGVGAALLGEPLLIGGLAALVIVVDDSAPWWAMALLGVKFVERLTLDAFTKPAMQVLYQPLPPSVRLRAQATSSTIVDQVAGGVVGALLLVTISIGGVDVRWLAGGLVAVCLAWWGVARVASTGYRRTLSSSLAARFVGSRQRRALDRDARRALLATVQGGEARRAMVALDALLEASDERTRRVSLHAAFANPAPAVRRVALGDRHDDALSALTGTLERLVVDDDDGEVRSMALSALARTGALSADAMVSHLASADPAVADAAAVRLLTERPADDAGRAHLEGLANADDAEQQLRALRAIAELGAPSWWKTLLRLEAGAAGGDGRRWHEALAKAWAALAAAGHEESRQRLLRALGQPGFAREAAADVMVSLDERVLRSVAELADDADGDRDTRHTAVRVLVGADRAPVDAQVAQMVLRHPVLRDAAMTSWLARERASFGEATVEVLRQVFDEELRLAADLASAFEAVEVDGDPSLAATRLHRALAWERRALALRIVRLAALLHPQAGLESAVGALVADAAEAKSYALELLETALPRGAARAVTELIEPPSTSAPDIDAVVRLAEHMAALEPWTLASVAVWLGDQQHPVPASLSERSEVKGLVDDLDEGDGPAALDVVMAAPCFMGAPPSALVRLTSACGARAIADGATLVRQGDDDDSLYLVSSGTFVVDIDGRAVEEIGAGAIVGELAPLVSAARSASVRATSAATVLELTRPQLQSALDASPALSLAMARVLADRLRRAS
jgi:AAA family ATP:ADP antiporter